MGSIINAIAIAAGGVLGISLKKGISEQIQDAIFKIIGIGVLIIGLNGVIANMIQLVDGQIKTSGELLLILSLVIGTFIGSALDLDKRLNSLSSVIEKRFRLSGFANSFVSATLLFSVGAMAIVGSINDGLLKDPSVLIVKSIIDGITSIIFGATLGMGVIFSSIPVLLYQGLITLLSSSLQHILVGAFLSDICMVGYTLVMCIGFNFLLPSKIKVANCLPAIFIPVVYHTAMRLFFA